jgi:hypothetical protein
MGGHEEDDMGDDARDQMLMSALVTEHFVLQSARGSTISESTARASLFLSTVSSALVAIGFFATNGDDALWIALAVLPVLVILGEITFVRVLETAIEDVALLDSIQRIRRHYATLAPDAARFFPAPSGSAAVNEMVETGARRGVRAIVFTLATAIAAVTIVLAAALMVIALGGVLDASTWLVGPAAVALVVGLMWGHLHWQRRRFGTVMASLESGR